MHVILPSSVQSTHLAGCLSAAPPVKKAKVDWKKKARKQEEGLDKPHKKVAKPDDSHKKLSANDRLFSFLTLSESDVTSPSNFPLNQLLQSPCQQRPLMLPLMQPDMPCEPNIFNFLGFGS